MSTGLNLKRLCGALVLSVAILCVASSPAAADTATSTHKQKKAKKAAPLGALAFGTDRAGSTDSAGFDRGRASASEI